MQDSLDVYTVSVTARTTWVFLKLSGASGEFGIGEATIHRHSSDIVAALPAAILAYNTCKLGLCAKQDAIRAAVAGPVGQAIISALEQSWLDRLGKVSGQPISALLGGNRRASISTYANINRGTVTREPQEFAQRAQAAIDNGYKAIKMAPFDGLEPEKSTQSQSDTERAELIQKGIDRIDAVARQVGANIELKVDCHSRLRAIEVSDTIERMADLGVSWLEEPMREATDSVEEIASFRKHANTKGILLAGAEKTPCLAAMTKFLNASCYDVVMPDIILAGGPMEVVRMGHLASAMNCKVSLHSPSGPVMDVMSAHVAATLPNFHSLERQYDESPLYDEIISRQHRISGGEYLLASVPGAGCSIDYSHPMVKHLANYSIDT